MERWSCLEEGEATGTYTHREPGSQSSGNCKNIAPPPKHLLPLSGCVGLQRGPKLSQSTFLLCPVDVRTVLRFHHT